MSDKVIITVNMVVYDLVVIFHIAVICDMAVLCERTCFVPIFRSITFRHAPLWCTLIGSSLLLN